MALALNLKTGRIEQLPPKNGAVRAVPKWRKGARGKVRCLQPGKKRGFLMPRKTFNALSRRN